MWGLKPSDLNPFQSFFHNRFIKFISDFIFVVIMAGLFSFAVIGLFEFRSIEIFLLAWLVLNLMIAYFFEKTNVEIKNAYLALLFYLFVLVSLSVGFVLAIIGIFFSKNAITILFSIYVLIIVVPSLKDIIFNKNQE